jgi:dTMP kinase
MIFAIRSTLDVPMLHDPRMPPGLFIVFEGLDGSGTSTQARLLHERLLASGVDAVLTAEPTDGPVGRLVRDALQHRVDFDLDPIQDERQMSYLFAADRFHHLHNEADGVLMHRSAGRVVVCARYVWSSFAYNCRSDQDVARIAHLNASFPAPDLTFFVEVPVSVSRERIDRRGLTEEKYESEEKLALVSRMYDRAMREFPCRHERLDGTLPPDALHERVVAAIGALREATTS